MGKKNRGGKTLETPASLGGDTFSSLGKKVMAAGVGTLVLGFILISFTDPMGRNWASFWAPFLIVGGYALVGVGIFLPETPAPDAPSNNPSGTSSSPR